MNCTVCEAKGIFDGGFCSVVCLDWYNKEVSRQEDIAINRMEHAISEAETDY